MKISEKLLIITLALTGLAACAAPGGAQSEVGRVSMESAADAPAPTEFVDKDQFYRILVGEVAGHRGRMDVAADYYLEAAKNTTDVRVARRAVQMAIAAGQADDAVVAAKRWIELDEDNADARLALAALYLQQQRYQDSADEFKGLIDAQASRDEGFKPVISALMRERDKKAAMQVAAVLVKAYPDSYRSHYLYAELALAAGALDVAYTHIEKALTQAGSNEEVWNGYARVMQARGETEVAVTRLYQLIESQQTTIALRLTYARLLMGVRRFDAAREQFQSLAQEAPDNGEVIYALAILAMERNDFEVSQDNFKHLLELGHRTAEAYFYLGQLTERQDDLEGAKEWYGQVPRGEYAINSRTRMLLIEAKQGRVEMARKYLKVFRERHPSHAEQLYRAEGNMLRELGRTEESVQLLTEALEAFPASIDLRYARAMVAETVGQLELAESDLRTIIKHDADNVAALNALGYTLADRTNRYAEALELIERAYALRSDDPAIIDSLGWIYYRLGRNDEAMQHLRRAMEMMKDPEIASHLGEVLWVTGDKDAARKVWQEALESHPENAVIKRVIDRLAP